MILKELKIKGAYYITPQVYSDERGSFRRSFCKDTMEAIGINFTCLQGNLSYNPVRGTLRGFHYQEEPYGEDKILTCVTGSIFDIIIDLRKESPTYMEWISLNLSAKKGDSLLIPKQCANAWLTTEKETTIHYYMSNIYYPTSGRGIRYNDPRFSFVWPEEINMISDKDKSYEDYEFTNI